MRRHGIVVAMKIIREARYVRGHDRPKWMEGEIEDVAPYISHESAYVGAGARRSRARYLVVAPARPPPVPQACTHLFVSVSVHHSVRVFVHGPG
jgi:hypothetical protein